MGDGRCMMGVGGRMTVDDNEELSMTYDRRWMRADAMYVDGEGGDDDAGADDDGVGDVRLG